MPYQVPDLPYAYDALEPWIDETTMHVHHDKHHQAYCDKTNDALKGLPFAEQPIEQVIAKVDTLPESIRQTVRNQGGGYLNHNFFWPLMSAKGGGDPSGPLGQALIQAFGSLEDFRKRFATAATTQFGSGWAWLTINDQKKPEVYSLPNQDSPLSKGQKPLLTLDVWEHAYYLKYQNRRPEYVEAFWKVVNWAEVERRYEEALA